MLNGSAYDHYAQQYVARGLHPVVIGPRTKKPQHHTSNGFVNTPSWQSRPVITTPQPGAGIGLLMGNGLLAIDLDDPEVAIVVRKYLPPTPCCKVGRPDRMTLFYRAPPGFESTAITIGDRKVVEFLATGKQTVLPPSIHPDTGKPYHWEGLSLLEVDLEDLPLLSEDVVGQLVDAINAAGDNATAPNLEDEDREEGGDSPYRQLNDFALKRENLPLWVPELGLYKFRRKPGWGPVYTCVASWRDGTTGKALPEREPNLKISPKGIKDFGDGRGYTPIDLIMAALKCDLQYAVKFLDEKLGWSTGGPDIVQDPEELSEEEPIREEAAWEAAQEDRLTEEEPAERLQRAREFLKDRGAWCAADDLPEPPTCSFERLLPEVGLGSLDGQWSTNKTHILTDLAVAFAAPGESYFAGHKRLRRGGVILFESEESEIPTRLACAAKYRGVDLKTLPILSFTEIRKILLNRKVDPKAVNWYRETLQAADYLFKTHYGVPLAMVGIDPLIDAYGAEKENSSEEANAAKGAFRKLVKEFLFLLWINDHLGKDIERGSRGTSAKPAGADFIFTLPERVADNNEPRAMWAKKLRNLPGSGAFGINFTLKTIQVPVRGGTASNLAVCWGNTVSKDDSEWSPKKAGRPPRKQGMALDVLAEMVSAVRSTSKTAVPWIDLQDWYDELVSRTIFEGTNQARDFANVKNGLLKEKLIRIRNGKVCIPVG